LTTVKVWDVDHGYNESLNSYCESDCIRECVKPCPTAIKCTLDQIECGKEDLAPGVWPDCQKDDKCVPDGCRCQIPGNDGSLCPLWCEKKCEDNQIKCPGKEDENGCKEMDVCINRPTGNQNQLCPGYCPVECNDVTEHVCTTDPVDGCPQAPTCNTKAQDNQGNYCEHQQCPLTCPITHKFCAGEQQEDGCYEADICVPKGEALSGVLCDGNCPVKCDPTVEILCDGTPIYHGPKAGCKNDDTCKEKARDVNGEYCHDSSASHECPIECKDDEHACPPRTGSDNCKEQATCTKCTKNNDGECCPQASDCPALCKPHEKQCIPPGEENGCPKPPVCIVQERDFYGDLCTVHCPGVCNENQIMCPGDRTDTGCPMPPTCQPVGKKLWGDDKGGDCPGFCPAHCQDYEITCAAVQDPCDGCPTEPRCKPKAKNVNGIYCPSESASHGCDISCKTLDGESTVCAAYADDTEPGCKERLICLARSKGTDGKLCPEHSVCAKKCAANEKKCPQGFDDNDCKNEDTCVVVPLDQHEKPCLDFKCSPKCDEEVQKYCQGQYQYNERSQFCPLVDYCVERPLDKNDIRCPGHCQPECGDGYEIVQQTGNDGRGCPLQAVCSPVSQD